LKAELAGMACLIRQMATARNIVKERLKFENSITQERWP
jgi:hypothetical protein